MHTTVPNSCFGGLRASENMSYHAQYALRNPPDEAIGLSITWKDWLSSNYCVRGEGKLWDQELDHRVSLCWCGEFLATISQS